MAAPILHPLLLALVAAALLGTSAQVSRQGLRFIDPRSGAMVSIGTTALLYWLSAPFFLHGGTWHTPALLIFAGIGLLHPALSLYMSFEGLSRLGATISATVASTAPLFAAAAAIAVLGESPTTSVVLGTLGIVFGVMLLSWRGRRKQDWAMAALLFPLTAAFIRGTVNIGFKVGLTLLPSPFTAALVSCTVSAATGVAVYRAQGRHFPLGPALRGLPFFLVSGTLNGLGVLAQYSALQEGMVILVTPIVCTYPLFTLASALLFRLERLTLRTCAAVALVVAGVVLVGIG